MSKTPISEIMKITIQHYNETASLETRDDLDLDEFRDHLTRLLHVIWLPEQVEEIMRVKDWDEGYKAGEENAKDDSRHSDDFSGVVSPIDNPDKEIVT